jgi:hypothetical protein
MERFIWMLKGEPMQFTIKICSGLEGPSWHATQKKPRLGATSLRRGTECYAGTRKKKVGETQKLGANPRDKNGDALVKEIGNLRCS